MEKREGQGQAAEQKRDNRRPNSRPKFNKERKEEADDLQKKLVCKIGRASCRERV